MDIIPQLILNSIIAGAIYTLVALGFNLIYGATKVFNLAHGVMAAVGGYTVFYLLWAWSAHPEQTKNSNYILRHDINAARDAEVLADHIIKQGFKKVGILYQKDEWGVASNQVLSDLLKAENIEVYSEAIDHKASDFRTPILKIKAQNPEAIVFIALGPAAGLLIKQTKEQQYNGALYSSMGFIATPDALKIVDESQLKGMYYLTDVPNKLFENDYRARFNKQPSALSYEAYTDMELLFYAIDKTGTTKPEEIIKFIKGMKEFEGKYEKVPIQPTGDIITPTIIKVWE